MAPASVLTAELRRYREIASELERAERLASLLPSLRPARFAAAREARIGYVLELAAKQSFDEAISLAASVGVDEWEVRLAAVQAALVVKLDGDGEAAAAAARAVVVQHDAQLLGQPTRFMGAIVETVWPKVQGLPLLPLALDLLVDCATKLRNQKGGKGKDGAPPPALLDHNAGVVAALHGVLRRLRIAAPAVDVRDVLVLTSAPADDAPAFARLAVAVAPAARRALRRAVGASPAAARRLALVAPELAACVAAGGAAPPPLLSASGVWALEAARRLRAGDGDGGVGGCISILPRLSTDHIAALAAALTPQASAPPAADGAAPPTLDAQVSSSAFLDADADDADADGAEPPVRLAAAAAHEVLGAAMGLLRARALASLGGGGGAAAAVVAAWRAVRRRAALVGTLAWLDGAAAAAGGARDAAARWAKAGGDARTERQVLLALACEGDLPVAALGELLSRWRAELTARGGGADGVIAALGSAADLIAHAAESLLLSLAGGGVGMLGKWRPPTEEAGLAMLRGLLARSVEASGAPPPAAPEDRRGRRPARAAPTSRSSRARATRAATAAAPTPPPRARCSSGC